MEKCKICGKKTCFAVNIKFNQVSICNPCSNSILLQQAQYLVEYSGGSQSSPKQEGEKSRRDSV